MALWKPSRRLFLAGAGLIAAPAIVRAQSPQIRQLMLRKMPAAAGGGITQAAIFGAASTVLGTSFTFSGLTLGTGDVVVGIATNVGTNAPSSVTVGGVAASQIGSGTDPSGKRSFWLATGVNTATGSVVVVTPNICDACVMGWLITGENTGSGALTSNLSGAVGDPQSITFTVPASGVGFVLVASAGGSTANPAAWTVATRDAVTESAATGGSNLVVSGAHIITTGSVSPTASGTGGGSYSFTNDSMLAITFTP